MKAFPWATSHQWQWQCSQAVGQQRQSAHHQTPDCHKLGSSSTSALAPWRWRTSTWSSSCAPTTGSSSPWSSPATGSARGYSRSWTRGRTRRCPPSPASGAAATSPAASTPPQGTSSVSEVGFLNFDIDTDSIHNIQRRWLDSYFSLLKVHASTFSHLRNLLKAIRRVLQTLGTIHKWRRNIGQPTVT